MKKFLPKFVTPKGFTLIELMVVVSIIAILSVIGVAIFSNVQKNARDARRKADIDAVSNAIEVNYNDATGKYIPLVATQFATGIIPKDPNDTGTQCLGSYCGYCGTATTTGAACAASNLSGTVPVPAAGGTSWVVCANLETAANGSNFYCKSSSR